MQEAQPWLAAEVVFRQSFAAQSVRIFEGRLLEIARRQSAEAIENREVGDGADLAIFVRERAQAAPPQANRDGIDAGGIGDGGFSIAAQSDRLEILRSHHRADSAAAGMAAFVADRGEANPIFARRADGRDPWSPGSSARFGSRLRSRSDFSRASVRPRRISTLSSLNKQIDQRGGLAGDHDGIDAQHVSTPGRNGSMRASRQ